MKVLACAVAFGLGPAGKLCSIVAQNEYEWYACGDEMDLSIYKSSPYIDTCWSKDKQVVKAFVEKHTIRYAIDVLDPVMAILLTDLGLQVIYVDSLPFMWTKADLIPYGVAYYCAQKYPNYSLNPALEPVNKLVWVDPIVPDAVSVPKGDYTVINFGGLHSPFGEGKEYLEIVLKALLPTLPKGNIFVTGSETVQRITKELCPELSCCTYHHEDFLRLVSGSGIFITSPGLTTIYETCNMDIETVILPPQNLSQFYNTSVAERVCRAVKVLHWNRENLSMRYLERFRDQREEEVLSFIYEQIRSLSKDYLYLDAFGRYVMDMMEKDFTLREARYFKYSGVNTVSELLRKLMEEV